MRPSKNRLKTASNCFCCVDIVPLGKNWRANYPFMGVASSESDFSPLAQASNRFWPVVVRYSYNIYYQTIMAT